jgi:Zn-dependent protease
MDISFIFVIAVLILSIVAHEAAHGYVANWLGDPTARLAGRLTLNPLKHVDLWGSIIIPGLLFFSGSSILFGWAKPVPYNPYNLKNQRWGEALVAGAGPATNLLIAITFGLLIRSAEGIQFGAVVGLNTPFFLLAVSVVQINIVLAFFNLIPLPPLDGSKVLAALLPIRAQMRYQEIAIQIQQFGLIGSFILIFIIANLLWTPFSVVIAAIFRLITGLHL